MTADAPSGRVFTLALGSSPNTSDEIYPIPTLAIIILHYGEVADTRACLAALTPGLPADWQLLVIDNGTGSGGPIF